MNLVRRIFIVVIIVLSFFGVLELLTKYVTPANKPLAQHAKVYINANLG